jgi:hypothetical protein
MPNLQLFGSGNLPRLLRIARLGTEAGDVVNVDAGYHITGY